MIGLKKTLLFIFSIAFLAAGAQEIDDLMPFLVSSDLKKDASATIIDDNTTLRIRDRGVAFLDVDKTVIVWNEKGDHHARLIVAYDQFRELEKFKGWVRSLKDSKPQKLTISDLDDLGSVSSSFIDDTRVKSYKPMEKNYPYMVRYQYTIQYPSTLFIKDWDPQPSYYLSVKKATFTVESPNDNPFMYKGINLPEPEIFRDDDETIYRWEVNDLPAVNNKRLSPPLSDITPSVLTGTSKFDVEGYSGSTSSWREFGEWMSSLCEGRQHIPPVTADEVRKIAAASPDTASAVCNIYRYMQERTRYVSIQLGIGGFQPEKAEKVDGLGYGDCKGLSNYMVALLREAGIRSHYTLVNAGEDATRVREDFPSNQFNHVIVCVPLESDTIWLECTSQITPCGFLGDFTGDRKVLLIDGEESKLVSTCGYPKEINTQHRKAVISLEPTGSGEAKVTTLYGGLQYDNVYHLLREVEEEQKKSLYQRIDIPKFQIKRFEFIEKKDRLPLLEESLDLYLDRYMAMSGSRAFLPLNLMNRFSRAPIEDTARTLDIHLRFPFIDTDSVIYHLPEGYVVESLPDPQDIETEFASYIMETVSSGDKIIFYRRLEIDKGTWPAEKYPDFVEFYKEVVKADKAMAVLVKQ